MIIPKIDYPQAAALALERFREMDYFAVNNYALPIELMMENAGLQLAKLTAHCVPEKSVVQIGIGNGNNGGGGLVAARRLAAWGYEVYLDLATDIDKELPARQLERSLKFGAKLGRHAHPVIWLDAYLGFSQRLPLRDEFLTAIQYANSLATIRLSLDIPTGFLGNLDLPFFQADMVLSLAAPKHILHQMPLGTSLYVADLGIPAAVYHQFDLPFLPFSESSILELSRS